MEPTGAAENLQVIRTLMERSALYRRAMAPVMLAAGLFGVAGWGLGKALSIDSLLAFVGFWFAIAALTVAVALLIVRRQAIGSAEPFWTPPTRRIIRAMVPSLAAGGLMTSSMLLVLPGAALEAAPICIMIWILFYGLAIHSAGMIISRGVRLLGWMFILPAPPLVPAIFAPGGIGFNGTALTWLTPNIQMGLTFGLFHLIAAAYLFLTERRGRTTQSAA